MEYRDAIYLEDGRIDCEINHPSLGWTPFTASSTDDSQISRAMHVKMAASEDVADYIPPPPITDEEILADWLSSASCDMLDLQDAIIDLGLFADAETASQSASDKWRIRWEARGGVSVMRCVPELTQFAATIGLTPDDLDAMPIWSPPYPEGLGNE